MAWRRERESVAEPGEAGAEVAPRRGRSRRAWAPAFTAALGTAAAVGPAGVFRLRAGSPPTLVRRLDPETLPEPGLAPLADAPFRVAAATLQQAGLDALLELVLLLAGLAGALAGVGLVILVAVRLVERGRERAVRSALGATPLRLFLETLRTVAVPGALGVAAGGLVGAGAGWALRGSWPGTVAGGGAVTSGVPAEAWALGGAVLGVLALAVGAGAWASRRTRSPGGAARVVGARGEGGMRAALAALQVAVALALLSGAGLLLRTTAGPGAGKADALSVAAPGELLTVPLALPAGENDDRDRAARYASLLERLADLSPRRTASLGSPGAREGLGTVASVTNVCGPCVVGGLYLPVRGERVTHHAVGPGWFDTLGIPVLRGREFTVDDRADTPRVALVNAAYARGSFHGGDPLGRTVLVGGVGGAAHTVVGVVPAIGGRGLGTGGPDRPALYLPALQVPPRRVELVVRVDDPEEGVAALEGALPAWVPGAGVGPARTAAAADRRQEAPLRWLGRLLSGLAAVTLVLALHGVGAVMRADVRAREREIGVRMALGASPLRILVETLRRGAGIVAVGAGVGGLAAISLAAALRIRVPAVDPVDPPLLGLLVALLASVALAGSLLPARRAARVDPAVPLQGE